MNLNIVKYLLHANQKVCPLISLEVDCGMLTHEHIRMLPSHYKRLSCRKVLQFCGDDPDILIYDCEYGKEYPMNVFIFNAIDRGMPLREIGRYIEREQEILVIA